MNYLIPSVEWVTVQPEDRAVIVYTDRYGQSNKIVAVAGYANDWAAYKAPADWTDDRVASDGDKISATMARDLFPCFKSLKYRE